MKDPSLIPQAVEEGLRYSSSVVVWRRRATRPVTIAGVEIPQDSKILISLGSANHDEVIFRDAETFDITREDARKRLAFGNGLHFCLGGPQARIELQVMLEELVRAFPRMSMSKNQNLDWERSLSFRGPKFLMVELA